MALTEEEIKELKSQLFEQIKDLPPQQKEAAQAQIDSMSSEALEAMLNQQKSQSQKIFRMIIDGQIPSVKIDENSHAIAVLSVKSVSKGHTLIIPKAPVTEEPKLPKEVHNLSEKISKKLIGSLKAKSTQIIPEKSFAEIILNVIPIYDKPITLQSKKIDIPAEELEKLKIEINIEKINKEPEKIIVQKKRKPRPIKLQRRIP